MQAVLYASTGNPAPQNSPNPSHLSANKLDLLPEHIAEIDKALHRQISMTRLTANELRLLLVIHQQTVGYNKREDDMNGARLEQLSKIRADHANETIRSLASKNVIFTHRGNYGKWMSINFDFAHWGAQFYGTYNNNPTILLPDYYQNTPIDVGLDLSKSAEKSTPELGDTINKNINTNTECNIDYQFPRTIPRKLHPKITQLLQQISHSQQAQALLNYFAQCLQNNTIHQPIAYFVTLKNRLFNGELQLSDRDKHAPKQQQAQQKQQQREIDYREALIDYQQMKKRLKQEAQELKLSFDEYIETSPCKRLWWRVTEKLESVGKEAASNKDKSYLPV